jgi:hypothetical protein
MPAVVFGKDEPGVKTQDGGNIIGSESAGVAPDTEVVEG